MYRSDLSARLPAGMSMPTAYAVVDLGDSAALWLEDVDHVEDSWDIDRFRRAARLLGQLAASEQVRPIVRAVRAAGHQPVRGYAEGRIARQLMPLLRQDEVWAHPLVAHSFDDSLRRRLLADANDFEAIVEELEAMPKARLHGDACTRNLLVRPQSDDFVVIDFAFFSEAPVGFDLGQLLLGEVQVGERPASQLPELEAACLPAYVEGLHREGCLVDEAVVRRAHALQMLLFNGLSALPVEHLNQPPTAAVQNLADQRAQIARFVLDLVDATA